MYPGEAPSQPESVVGCAGAYRLGPSPTWQAVSSKAKERDTFHVQRKVLWSLISRSVTNSYCLSS